MLEEGLPAAVFHELKEFYHLLAGVKGRARNGRALHLHGQHITK